MIQTITSQVGNQDQKMQILQVLAQNVQHEQNINNIQIIMKFLCKQLKENKDQILLVYRVYCDILKNPQIQEKYVQAILPGIVENLGHQDAQVRKGSHNVFISYIRVFKNLNTVLDAFIQQGIENIDWQVRQKSVNSLQGLFIIEPNLLVIDSPAMKIIIDYLIEKQTDPNTNIQKAAEQCIQTLKQFDKFPQNNILKFDQQKQTSPFKKNYLSAQKQQTQNKHFANIAKTNLLTDSSFGGFRGSTADDDRFSKQINLVDQQQDSLIQFSSHNKKTQLLDQKMEFGVFPLGLINVLKENDDWKQRTESIEKMLDILNQIFENSEYSLKDSINSNLYDLLGFIAQLLNDSNFKIQLISTQILELLIQLPDIQQPKNYFYLANIFIKKLGESKIAIRQAISKIFKTLTKIIKSNQIWLKLFLENLSDANALAKEEILSLIGFLIVSISDKEFNLDLAQYLIESISPLVSTSKQKVQLAALDCLILISRKMPFEDFEIHVQSMLSAQDYELLLQKTTFNQNIYTSQKNFNDQVLNKLKLYQQTLAQFKKNQESKINYDSSLKSRTITPISKFDELFDSSGIDQSFNMKLINEIKDKNYNNRTLINAKLSKQQENDQNNSTNDVSGRYYETSTITSETSYVNNKKQYSISKQQSINNNQVNFLHDDNLDIASALSIIQKNPILTDQNIPTQPLFSRQKFANNQPQINNNNNQNTIFLNTNIINIDDTHKNNQILNHNIQQNYLQNLNTKTSNYNNVNQKNINYNQHDQIQSIKIDDDNEKKQNNQYNNVPKMNIEFQDDNVRRDKFMKNFKKISNMRKGSNEIKLLESKNQRSTNYKQTEMLELQLDQFQTKVQNSENDSLIDLKIHKSISCAEKQDKKSFLRKKQPEPLKNDQAFEGVYQSAFDQKAFVYLEQHELQPLKNIQKDFKQMVANLQSDDWSEQFNGINLLRTVNLHHSELLNPQNIHPLIVNILKGIDSLRSGYKNHIIDIQFQSKLIINILKQI